MQTVSWAGNTYNIPNQRGDSPWSGLSDFAIAVAAKGINVNGGNFTLLADINYGASFGIVSTYFKSRTANIATAGILRLANADLIDWRNFANSGNLALAVNTSDQLTFNGVVLSTAATTVTSVSGTTNQINSTGGTTPVLSLSSTLVVPGTFTIPATTNQIVLGTTNTTTITSPAPAASRTVTLPDAGANSSIVLTAGAQSIAGTKTFTDPIVQNDTTNQLVLGVTNTTTISATAPTTSRTVTIPDPGANASFVMTESAQTINGQKTFADPIVQNDTTNQLVLGVTNTTTISSTAPAASRTVTIPDAGANSNVVLSEGTATINGVKTFAGQLIGKGTATNDNAAAGFIGEYVSSVVSAVSFPTTDNYGDLTSISLTAGDWNVSGSFLATINGATVTQVIIGISTTSGNSGTGLVDGDSSNRAIGPTATYDSSTFVPVLRVSLSATTTYYLKFRAQYTVATPRASGRLSARRVR